MRKPGRSKDEPGTRRRYYLSWRAPCKAARGTPGLEASAFGRNRLFDRSRELHQDLVRLGGIGDGIELATRGDQPQAAGRKQGVGAGEFLQRQRTLGDIEVQAVRL